MADNELDIIISADYSGFSAAADDVSSMLLDLEGGAEVEITTNVDTSGIDALDEIPDETTTDLDITETSDAQQAIADIHFMALKDKIETVWNIVKTGADIAMDFVNPLLDVDDAVAHINAQTGNGTGIDDLGQFIRDMQGADLGTGVDQIESVVIAATQLHAPIEEATRASLTFTHTFTDENPVTVMKTLKASADEFGISITEASDLMTIFFQQGGNKGGDALATVDRYSTSWHDMGLSITEALSLVSSLMSGGVDTADAAAKMVQTFDDSFTAASVDPNSQQAKLLAAMGIDNPKDAGQAIGAETIDGFVEAFNNLPADQQDLASQLFFGKGGKLNTSAISGATTQSDMFKDYKDAAIAAASDMDNSLRGAIDDFILAINTSVADFLSSDKIDLDGFISRLKDGFQAAVGVLTGGGSIGEALEVGFNIQGFDTTVANLQRIFGNFEIIILQAIMAIQRLQGMDTTSLATQIADLSKGQLSFDLQIANADEIPTMVNQAFQRGVDAGNVGDAMGTAIQESIDKANFDQAGTLIQGYLDAAAKNGPGALATMQEFVKPYADALQTAMSDAMKIIGPSQTGTSPLTSSLFGAPGAGGTGGGDMFGVQAALDGITTSAQTATENTQASFDNLSVSMATPVGTIVGQIGNINTAVDGLDTNTANRLTENTVTTTFEELADSARENFQIVIRWLQNTTQAVFDLDFAAGQLSNIPQLLKDITAAMDKFDTNKLIAIGNAVHGGGGGGGGGDTTNNTTINASQTNNIQNNADSAGAGYGFASATRGQGG